MTDPCRLAFAGVLLLLSAAAFGTDSNQGSSSDSILAAELQRVCVFSPGVCRDTSLRRFLERSRTERFEPTFNGISLSVPLGYVSEGQGSAKRGINQAETSLLLVAQLPGLDPRQATNLSRFYVPYDRNAIHIHVVARTPAAIDWTESLIRKKDFYLGFAKSPVRRKSEYDLEITGEDFKKFPKARPCSSLKEDESTCTRAYARDVLETKDLRVLLACDPDVLEDSEAWLGSADAATAEFYFGSRSWVGRRRATCEHYFHYEPLNASIRLDYGRHNLKEWQRTQRAVESLLNTFIMSNSSNH